MDVGNWILFAKAARELKIPFVASGGCADGKQLAAALALGAEGMNMGTRFMATVEAPIHANIKQALVDGDEHSTTLIMRSLKNTERVFNNKTAKKVLEIEAEFPGQFEKIQPWVSGNRYEHDPGTAYTGTAYSVYHQPSSEPFASPIPVKTYCVLCNASFTPFSLFCPPSPKTAYTRLTTNTALSLPLPNTIHHSPRSLLSFLSLSPSHPPPSPPLYAVTKMPFKLQET